MYQALFFSLSSERSKEAKKNNNNARSQVSLQYVLLIQAGITVSKGTLLVTRVEFSIDKIINVHH